MATWVLKWRSDGQYLRAWDGRTASWANGQKSARRFKALTEARRLANKWNWKAVMVVRLVPRKR